MNVKVEEPGKNNIHNNAFYAEETLLRSEQQAIRDCNPLSGRHWIVRIHTEIRICGYGPIWFRVLSCRIPENCFSLLL